MNILIKGVEMPKGNDELRLIIRSNGQVIISHKTYYEEAEAVIVPPHGDLIERDKLREKEFIYDGDAYAVVMSRDIRNAPTVIPASEEGEA